MPCWGKAYRCTPARVLTFSRLRQYSQRMKRIAVFVCFAYAAVFVALTWPVIMIAFSPIPMEKCVAVYSTWTYWILLGVLLLCQAGLLLIPLRIASRRPVSRKHVFLPVIVSGFLVALLALSVIGSLNEFLQGKPAWGARWERWCALAAVLAIWAAWSVVFCRIARREDPKSVLLQQCKRLLQGSVITLLVAVPTHIVARWRGYCCAGLSTFLGITFGLAVMLACFGPAVYFQFVVDGGDMVLDRAFSNHERICNLFIRLPLCQQLQYLQFAWAQRRYRISWLSCK